MDANTTAIMSDTVIALAVICTPHILTYDTEIPTEFTIE
jgi:hypothetical protein